MNPVNNQEESRQNERSRLDMQHGFIRSIVKNQRDRDQYDKEVKEKEAAQKSFVKTLSKTQNKKEKRPEIPIYVPPHRKNNGGQQGNGTKNNNDASAGSVAPSGDSVKDILFRLEFEDEQGRIHDIIVHKNEDPRDIASNVNKSAGGLSSATFKILVDRLTKEIRARSISG